MAWNCTCCGELTEWTNIGSRREALRVLKLKKQYADRWRAIPPPKIPCSCNLVRKKHPEKWYLKCKTCKTDPQIRYRKMMGRWASVVYFIQASDGRMKIGYTRNLPLRLQALRANVPHRLELVGFVSGDARDEYHFHSTFSRLRSTGEWFWRPDLILRYAKEHPDYRFYNNPGVG